MILITKDCGVSLEGLQKIWSRTELGESGKHIAAEVWMSLKHLGHPPKHLARPESKDLGRQAKLTWQGAEVTGVLKGYQWGGAVAKVEGNDGKEYFIASDFVKFV